MKRTMTFLLAVLLLLGLAACGGGEDPAVGKYSFSQMQAMGMTMDATALQALGMEAGGFMLEIKADGTFAMSMPTSDENESGEGTWEKSGDGYTMTVEDQSISAKYDKDAKTMSMVLSIDGVEGTLVFKK